MAHASEIKWFGKINFSNNARIEFGSCILSSAREKVSMFMGVLLAEIWYLDFKMAQTAMGKIAVNAPK